MYIKQVSNFMYNINVKLYNLNSNFLKANNTIPFIIASKNNIKHLGINLTRETKDLYTENYKIAEGN